MSHPYKHTVIKHIRCLPCKRLILVRSVSTTQGADTPEDKAYQDRIVENFINNRSTVLGFYICPKCKHRATITDPPLCFVGEDGNLLRDDKGNLISKYPDEIDMDSVTFDRYGFARMERGSL